jgi:hypothetical protein
MKNAMKKLLCAQSLGIRGGAPAKGGFGLADDLFV